MTIDEELTALREELARLRAAVVVHHSQKADDLCWLDDDTLYAAFGLPPRDNCVGDKDAVPENCKRFSARRRLGDGNWKSYRELEVENAALRASILATATASESAHKHLTDWQREHG